MGALLIVVVVIIVALLLTAIAMRAPVVKRDEQGVRIVTTPLQSPGIIAEAGRQRRAKIVNAQGESLAAASLEHAAGGSGPAIATAVHSAVPQPG